MWSGARRIQSIALPAFTILFLSGLSLLGACSPDITSYLHGTGWISEELVTGPEVGMHASITTTSDGTVHVVYHDTRYFRLYHARSNPSGGFIHAQIDTPGWVGHAPRLVAGPGDTLHLVYQDCKVNSIRYGTYTGGQWSFEYVGQNIRGESADILIRDDLIQLVVLDNDTHRVTYWWRNSGLWNQGGHTSVYDIPRSSPCLTYVGGNLYIAITSLRYVSGRSSGPRGFRVYLNTSNDGGIIWQPILIEENDSLLRNEVYSQSPKSVVLVNDTALGPHCIYQQPGGILWDNISGIIDQGVTNSQIACCQSATGDTWILYQKQNDLTIARYVQGNGWSIVTRLQAVYPNREESRWDLDIDSQETAHICVYNTRTSSLWYARWSANP